MLGSGRVEEGMPDFGVGRDELARLIRLVETRGLAKLVVEEEGCRVVIRGPSALRRADAPAASTPGGLPAALPPPTDSREGLISVESPMVGVFFRAPRPDTPPFVEVGDHVESGQPIGLIEAMKVFSEIPAEHSGTVVEIPAQNGQLVRTGEPLIYLRPE